jgi:PAS domain S-box-containing protein
MAGSIRSAIINLIDTLSQRLAGSSVDYSSVADEQIRGVQIEDLFNIAVDGIIIFDHHQNVRYFNKGAETIFGYTEAEVIGQSIDILLPPRFAQSHRKEMIAFASGNVTSRLMGGRREIVGRRKNGVEFPADASIATNMVNNQPVFYTILRDISKQKQDAEELRKSEERFRKIFEHTYDAILVIDPTAGSIIDVNPAACRMFGFSYEEMKGLNIADIHPKDSPKFRDFTQTVINQGEGWTDELICLTKSGGTLSSEVSASLIDLHDRQLMIALFRDISERKEIERMKDAFVSNVSHELKTPLTSMKLYSHLITLRPEKQEEYTKILVREVERQEVIIEDLLRLSQLDRGDKVLEKATVNLNDLVAEIVADRMALARQQNLTLTYEIEPGLSSIQADASLLGQVLSILLTNAFNYTPAGGSVRVSTIAKGSEWSGFSVCDTGLGIQAQDQAHLFERFYRGEVGKESKKPGTGLGLAIAKEIVDRHQGVIDVESLSIPGNGSCFTVWIPR